MPGVHVFTTVADVEGYLDDHDVIMQATCNHGAWHVHLLGDGTRIEGQGTTLFEAFADAVSRYEALLSLTRPEE